MTVLLDTNILIDYFTFREPFTDDAQKIIQLCKDKKIEACIAAHSVMNIFYILRKEFTVEERKNILLDLCDLVTVVGIDKDKIISSLGNDTYTDIEDCLQEECAKFASSDYIITRNIKDFQNSTIPVISPDKFLLQLSHVL